jgi:alpha 1,6-mannosyltransferase
MTLREKLAADFPYDVESFFPAFIWQTWKTTPTNPDFAFRQQEATWTEKHPEYVHEVITDEVAYLLVEHLFQKTPEVLEAYDALPRVILKADFFRYLILLARGGIYTDIDTQCLKPCWDWVPARIPYDTYGLVIGIEADPDREDWQKWYSRRIQFVQWTLRAKAGHPALIEAVATVTERVLALHREGSLASLAPDKVVELTGPAMWTDAVFRTLNTDESRALQEANLQFALGQEIDWQQMTGLKEQRQFGDIVVLPITGFSPGQGHMGSEPFDHPMAMVKHDFEGSWKPEDERMKDKDEKGRDVQWDKDGNIIPYAD